MQKLHLDSKKCMKFSGGISLLITIVVIILGYFLCDKFLSLKYHKYFYIIASFILILELIEYFLIINLRFKRYKYQVTQEKIEIIEGVISVKDTIIPIERIHQIRLKEGPIDKRYGLVNLDILTAGGNATISFIKKEEGEKIGEFLTEKVNSIKRGEV
ncbi:MAG: PH domain-containing protein [Clostridium sp.]